MLESKVEFNFGSIKTLVRAFKDAGCEKVFVKMLSLNQDNEKNQIYLGTEDTLLSVFPGKLTYSSKSDSTKKRHSAPGVGKLVLNLDFAWLWPDGSTTKAPDGKIIYYFQYPEIRFSGFLRGAQRSPRALRRNEQDEFGRRALVFGIKGEQTLGAVVTDLDGPALINELATLQPMPGQSLIKVLPLPDSTSSTNLSSLLHELESIAGKWQPAQFFGKDDLAPKPKQAQQGSGWTLEALLGIRHNSMSGPDKYGYELKVLSPRGPLSLITTEPNSGIRHDLGLTEYLHQFGWPGTKADGSHRFNGEHNTSRPYKKSGAIIIIEHWDASLNAPDGSGPPQVKLVMRDTGEVIAGWSLDLLKQKWGNKHEGCVYVEYSRQPLKGALASDYRFGDLAYSGLGTSVNHLLRALSDSTVYFDPGDRVLADGKEKARWQWRIKNTKGAPLTTRLPTLYNDWQTHRIVP